MKKIERILAIIVLLLDNEIVSTAQLAQRFDVTKRTIFRDMETIEMAGFPIISHSGRNGGFSLINSFKLKTYTYSESEKEAILNALNVQEGLFGIFDDQAIIKEKITQLQKQTEHKMIPKKRFSFDSPTMHRLEIETETKVKINQINLALKQNKKILIDYVDNKGDHTNRLIHPYELMLMNGSWYIYSYCENREAFRYFKVTRIRQLAIHSADFDPIEYSNDQILEKREEKIHLRFKKEELGKLYDYYTEDEIQVKETYVDVIIYAKQQRMILPFLLMFGSGVNVIEPKTLKELHKQEIIKLTQTYKN
ncbi:helix-turn-helix transcriptional regulator [Enterococcus sp. AZ126]|uniref:helix-turn-helix transcriptional regulator n=1 Tax=Enterococcus sp. AZ126 TaxID=2774635 RepID=UPI003F29F39E